MARPGQPAAFTDREARKRGLASLDPSTLERPIDVCGVAARATVAATRTFIRFDPLARRVFGRRVLVRPWATKPDEVLVVRLRNGRVRPLALARVLMALVAHSEPDPVQKGRRVVRQLSISLLARALGYRVRRGRCATVSAYLAELRELGVMPWTVDVERRAKDGGARRVASNQPARHCTGDIARGQRVSHRTHRRGGAWQERGPRGAAELLEHKQQHEHCHEDQCCQFAGCACGRPFAFAIRTIIRDHELLPPAS